jgi:hypothetical protein
MRESISANHRDERTQELLSKLEEGINSLTTSEGYKNWLRTQSLFHHYSWGNSLLIAFEQADRGLQPEEVAGFHAWHNFDRIVKKGAKAIWVLAPVTITLRKKDEETGEEKVSHPIVNWKGVPVFTVSDTEGKELPDHPCHILVGEGNQEALKAVQSAIEQEGFTFSFVDPFELHGANGVTNHLDRSVKVRNDVEPLQQLKTAAHEYGHVKLHSPEDGLWECRGVKELEAESVAFCALAACGLDSGDYSFGYLTTWVGGGEEAIKNLKTSATHIQHATDALITHLEAAGQALQQETTWETATDQEQALVASHLHGEGKTGQTLSSRDEALAKLRQQHEIDSADDEAIRRMEEISQERDHQLVRSR